MTAMMAGWPAVWAFIAILLAAAIVLIRFAVRRWWDAAIVLAVAAAVFVPIL